MESRESSSSTHTDTAVPSDADLLARIEDTLRTRYHAWTFLDDVKLPASLLTHLRAALPHIPPEEWHERFDFGGVYVNGIPALCDVVLPCPCRIEYYEPKFAIRDAAKIYPEFTAEYMLYADDDIAVVYKPNRLPSMPAKEQRHFSVKRAVEQLTGREVHMPSRLDVSTQGLLVMSISSRSHGPMQRAFESRTVEKRYALATRRTPEWVRCTTTSAIGRDERHPVLRRIDENLGQTAKTDFIVCGASSDGLTVVEARPHTGRTHQIRVHARELGIVIEGDNFYGGAPSETLHLLSRAVAFPHPASGEKVSFELPSSLLPSWARDVNWPG